MKVIVLLLFVFYTSIAFGQLSSDSLFSLARQNAFNGKHAEAKNYCYMIMKQSPDYTEPQVFLARIYSWNSMYDSSRIILKGVLEKENDNSNALEVSILVESWNDKYEEALKYCNLALQFYPENEKFLILKVKALRNLKRYNEAIDILNKMLAKNPENKEALDLLNAIRIETAKNKISTGYTLDVFENNSPEPWHLAYLQYSRKTPVGSVIGRVNMANRFGYYGWQYELESYPSFIDNYYFYLNAGYSEAVIFPKWRFGAEVYHSFPASFEGSLGLRHLIFSSSSVTIYTGYIGKYVGNFWFSLRSYVTPGNSSTSVSFSFLTRKYFSDSDNYIAFSVGYGVSPDERKRIISDASNFTLKSYKTGFSYNRKFNDFWLFGTGLSFQHEEYRTDSFRNVYTFDISLGRIF